MRIMLGVWNKFELCGITRICVQDSRESGIICNWQYKGEMDDDSLFWWTVHLFSK